VRLLRALLVLTTLVSPALAQTGTSGGPSAGSSDGPTIAAGVKSAADQAVTYLEVSAKAGKRPDLAKPPISNLFGQVFNVQQLAALPPPTAKDVMWLAGWTAAANQVNKAILFFGITQPVDPIADAPAIKRNMTEFEDQQTVALSFLIRIAARQTQAMFLFMDQLPPEQRTPIREEGFNHARVGAAEMVYGAVTAIAQGMKPANDRLLSAAIRDTGDVWAADILPKDRPQVLATLAAAQKATKDDETYKNLAAFSATLAAAK
jgi:hypothetical protein